MTENKALSEFEDIVKTFEEYLGFSPEGWAGVETIRQALQSKGWQPISTAPRDECPVCSKCVVCGGSRVLD